MKVWIGDPCHVLTSDQYDQVLDRNDPEVDVDETFTCVVYNTWNGDGTFTDQHGREYIVDSGQLCVIPECCIREDRIDTFYSKCGQVVDDSDWVNFFVDDHSENNGTIQFGDVIIKTGPDEVG